MAENRPRNENMIAALKLERAGYVARGLDDRVAQVDEQLKFYGHTVEVSEQRAASQAEDEQPKRRGRPPKSTAEQQAKEES